MVIEPQTHGTTSQRVLRPGLNSGSSRIDHARNSFPRIFLKIPLSMYCVVRAEWNDLVVGSYIVDAASLTSFEIEVVRIHEVHAPDE